MRRMAILGVVPVALAVALSACSGGSAETHAVAESNEQTKASQLHDGMRKLWEDHITWTRLFIVAAADGLGDTDETAGRLLRNQDDIGNAIKPFYGDEAGAALTKLLREHILTASELLTAAKAGDGQKVTTVKTTWYANADEIAAFLAKANPKSWPLDALQDHMRTHLDLTLEEAVARLEKRHDDEIAAYDQIHDAILELSDELAAGIVAQFPDRFAA